MEHFWEATQVCHRKFVAWRDAHPQGFVLNWKTKRKAMLHRGDCLHLKFRKDEPVILTRHRKSCSTQRHKLESFVAGEKDASMVRCGTCDV